MDEKNADSSHVVPNTLRLLGDTLVAPGTSLVLDGKLGSGAARMIVGVAARAAFGPIGWLAVAADAYAKSTTGTGLVERIVGLRSSSTPATTLAPQAVEQAVPVTAVAPPVTKGT
jgi:hypothetical protein